ncbi:MAG: PSD1 and planctomycete cytochrome C domain-containing protein [Fuerstiella sp.]|nr:PSD1 and planctomycete cytochrome C domain-containing protein [Fuerstiella sp.]
MNSILHRKPGCHDCTHSYRTTFLCCVACLCFTGQASWAAEVDYEKQIKPILANHCFSCHGALRQQSGLRLDAVQLIREGGDRGSAIEPGRSEQSVLVEAVLGTGDVERMPPEDHGPPLSDEQVSLLRAWIDQGAEAPDEPVPPDPRSHWAYQVPVRPPVPVVSDSLWQNNPIDAFLAATYEREGLVHAAPALREVLLRRVFFDLTGLPPTREELHGFLTDSSEQAWETVVDGLLLSPRYGERWGRHWMDIWRYTDWSGLENKMRHSQKHIWRWRDWIIESLNEDKGYDSMILEMLAGDELDPANPDTVRATGFLARNWYRYNRNFWLNDIIEHTAKGFLGITFNCARCHEHKYDPISHEDYYRFRAFFEPHDVRLDPVGLETDLEKDGLPRVYDAQPEAKTYLFIRGEETRPDTDHPHLPAVPSVLGVVGELIQPVSLPLDAYFPALRSQSRQAAIAVADLDVKTAVRELEEIQSLIATIRTGQDAVPARQIESGAAANTPEDSNESSDGEIVSLAHAKRELAAAQKKLTITKASRNALQAVLAADLATFVEKSRSREELDELQQIALHSKQYAACLEAELELLLAENELAAAKELSGADDETVRKTVSTARNKVTTAADNLKAVQADSSSAASEDIHAGVVYPSTSTGRRLALARWIVHNSNPLTARVAVNHIWTRHFGTPLVDSMFDFGLRTKRPAHHELLDWLAVEFMEHKWSMKHLHRLILTSRAYRMQSGSTDLTRRNTGIDPDNRLLWKMNPRRMEGELVRDTLICLTGQLDSTMGGPDLPITREDNGMRRTIYYRYSRDYQIKFLSVFNPASVEECYRRRHSIVPQQALAMTNSKLVLERGRQLAALVSDEVGTENSDEVNGAFIESAFERLLGRSATSAERTACAEALREFTISASADGMSTDTAHQRARENVVHVLLNHNDFITIR